MRKWYRQFYSEDVVETGSKAGPDMSRQSAMDRLDRRLSGTCMKNSHLADIVISAG